MRVFIYRNLNQPGIVFSVKLMEGPLKGRVVGHANGLFLQNCEFHVSEAGRQRVLKEKRKNVHAGVVGDLVAVTGYRTRIHNAGMIFENINEEAWHKKYAAGIPVTYNPYRYSSFVIKGTTSAIRKSENVRIDGTGINAYFKQKGENKTYLK